MMHAADFGEVRPPLSRPARTVVVSSTLTLLPRSKLLPTKSPSKVSRSEFLIMIAC